MKAATTPGCLALPVSANATTWSIWPMFVLNMPVIIGPIISEIVKCQYLLILTMYEKWLQVIHTVAKEGGLISWPKPFTHATDIKKGVGEDTFRMGHAPRQHFLRVFEVDFGVGRIAGAVDQLVGVLL